ncbi:protein KATNIP homolog isoform X2 [Neodiprion pinetum]|uniref:protein KATNIP homolog isoform X2 n=1 Tax=Neodiprion pinetum TaxID=441929 RepID=UPI001EE11412|nr:katanin-interacting protein-like isoform X2 [Neodiprion pinetum]
MEKVTSDDASISDSNRIFNKLPPWLAEMTESVKKLKTPEERVNFLSCKPFASDESSISPAVSSMIIGVTEKSNRTNEEPRQLPFTVETPDGVGGCIILQSSTTASLPNTPKDEHEFSRAYSALSAFSLPESNENKFAMLDKYLEKKDVEKATDSKSGVKSWERLHSPLESKPSAETEQRLDRSVLDRKPFERLAANHSAIDVQIKKTRRTTRQQQQITGKPSRIHIPPYRRTSTDLLEEETGLNLPIGVVRRKQDYLAGVASRGDIRVESSDPVRSDEKMINGNRLRIETTVSAPASISQQKNVSKLPITDKVAKLNLQASGKPALTEVVKKSVQTDLNQAESSPNSLLSNCRRPLYHYERYPPKENSIAYDFIIPELPRGTTLVIDILTTWGDKHYVGLNGIEIFSDIGEPVCISKIWADPTDINVLPEYNNDPRVVGNLINGINQTTDDYNLWLAPYTSGSHHYIHMTFEAAVNVAMIRIWNYNKSRIHSYRGVRDVKITLDDVVIFDGEIARASGGVFGNINSFGDTILFTTEGNILELISKHDATYSFGAGEIESPTKETDRPITTDTGEGRPLTCASSNQSNSSNYSSNIFSYICKEVELVLLSNWGHSGLIGLTGIELIGDQDSTIPLTQASLSCNVGCKHLNRLIDGNNLTTEPSHMWATYFLRGDNPTLTITFQTEIFFTGIRIWNYNASLDLSYCGVRQMLIKLDGKSVCNDCDGFMLRRAPGSCHYDFLQEINFANQSAISEPLKHRITSIDAFLKANRMCDNADYEAPMMPQGFVYQVIIFSTWGDSYYVGLTGIEMYDSSGCMIKLTKDNITAYPESVNVIEGVDNDVRTPDKLVDGVNDTTDGHHMWLAPILPNQTNRIYIIFDSPVMVSAIKMWNYKKTPQRGVKEFAILVDDLLVYNGVLHSHIPYGTVLFSGNKDDASENHSLIQSAQIGQDTKLLNLERRATSGGDCYADPLLRPHTSLMQANVRNNTKPNM